jgi:flagellar basal body-associated protein FliL
VNDQITNKDSKKKRIILISIIAVVLISAIIAIILIFSPGKIPERYQGEYTTISYFPNGLYYRITYKITSSEIKEISEFFEDGEKKTITKKFDYYMKNDDLIIKNDDSESYIIIEDDLLFIS